MSQIRTLSLFLLLGLLGALGAGCGEEGGDMVILTMEPQVGPTDGDQRVTITGHNFRTDIGYTIYFGSKRAQRVAIADPDTMLVVTPRTQDEGAVDVQIIPDTGQGFRIVNGFTYQSGGGGGESTMGSLAY